MSLGEKTIPSCRVCVPGAKGTRDDHDSRFSAPLDVADNVKDLSLGPRPDDLDIVLTKMSVGGHSSIA
jgi:hypothetical protein